MRPRRYWDLINAFEGAASRGLRLHSCQELRPRELRRVIYSAGPFRLVRRGLLLARPQRGRAGTRRQVEPPVRTGIERPRSLGAASVHGVTHGGCPRGRSHAGFAAPLGSLRFSLGPVALLALISATHTPLAALIVVIVLGMGLRRPAPIPQVRLLDEPPTMLGPRLLARVRSAARGRRATATVAEGGCRHQASSARTRTTSSQRAACVMGVALEELQRVGERPEPLEHGSAEPCHLLCALTPRAVDAWDAAGMHSVKSPRAAAAGVLRRRVMVVVILPSGRRLRLAFR